jgi:Family of unknown function (DUF6279)
VKRSTRFGLALCVLLLGACSSTTFLYNRLHIIIPWYLNDYVDLTREQGTQLDQLLEPFLAWHRTEELPAYLELLDSIVTGLDNPVTAQEIQQQALVIETLWYRLEARSVEWMLSLGEGLSDEQVADLIAKLEKDQRKYEKKYLERDEQEYREELYENFLDNAQDFIGRLSREQKQMVEESMAQMTRSDDLWLAERAAWLDRMRDVLQRDAGWQQAIRDDVGERDQSTAAEYDEVMEHNLAIIHQAMADLINSRTEKQDRRLRGKMAGIREDLQTLIAQ